MRFGKSDFSYELGWFRDDFETEFDRYWWLDSPSPPDDSSADAWRALVQVRDLADSVASVAKSLLRRRGLGASRLQAGAQLAAEADRMEKNVALILERAKGMAGLTDVQRAKLAEALESPGSIDDPRARYLVFIARLQQHAHDEYNRSPARMAERIQRLVRYLVQFPGERAHAYLGRVAECFVLDMRAELAVMTRAVLESAIEDVVQEETVRAALRLGSNERVGLSNLIAYCENHRHGPVFGAKATAAAKRIKEAGDDAAHLVPGLEQNPEELLSDLATCLTDLERQRPVK